MNSIEKINKDLQRAFSQFGVTAEQAVKNLRANMAGMDTSAPDAPQSTNAPEPIATHHSQEITLQEAIDATAALNDKYGEDAIHEHLRRMMDLQYARLTQHEDNDNG